MPAPPWVPVLEPLHLQDHFPRLLSRIFCAPDGSLWICCGFRGHDRGSLGVSRVDPVDRSVVRFSADHGLPLDVFCLAWIEGRLAAGTKEGLHVRDDEGVFRVAPDTPLGRGAVYDISPTSEGFFALREDRVELVRGRTVAQTWGTPSLGEPQRLRRVHAGRDGRTFFLGSDTKAPREGPLPAWVGVVGEELLNVEVLDTAKPLPNASYCVAAAATPIGYLYALRDVLCYSAYPQSLGDRPRCAVIHRLPHLVLAMQVSIPGVYVAGLADGMLAGFGIVEEGRRATYVPLWVIKEVQECVYDIVAADRSLFVALSHDVGRIRSDRA